MNDSTLHPIRYAAVALFALMVGLGCSDDVPTSPHTEPTLWIHPSDTLLNFTANLGGPNPAPRIIKVYNAGIDRLKFDLESTGQSMWLQLFRYGQIAPDSFIVSINVGQLPESYVALGLCTDTIVVSQVGSPTDSQCIHVQLRVREVTGGWERQVSSTDKDLLDVAFADSLNGWAVGAAGTILHTGDGGDSWEMQNSRSPAFFTNVDFVDEERGWIYGYSPAQVLTTGNGGETWALIWPDDSVGLGVWFRDIDFVDKQNGWAVGWQTTGDSDRGIIMNTTNGGWSWSVQYLSESDLVPLLEDVYFLNSQLGWVVGPSGTILHTSDGGRHWNNQAPDNLDDHLIRVQMVSEGVGWAMSTRAIFRTDNFGVSWAQLSRDKFDIRNFCFVDDQTGWLVGGMGAIYQTVDGGSSWQLQSVGQVSSLGAVTFVDNNRGYAVGTDGAILATGTGGL